MEAGSSPDCGSSPSASRQYEVGDEIDLRVRAVEFPIRGIVGAKVVYPDGSLSPYQTCFRTEELDAGKLVPRPIKVGDRVRLGSSLPGTVRAIFDEDRAAVKWETSWPHYTVQPLSGLVRVSS